MSSNRRKMEQLENENRDLKAQLLEKTTQLEGEKTTGEAGRSVSENSNSELDTLREQNRDYQRQIRKLMAAHKERALDSSRKSLRRIAAECSGCKQTLFKSRRDLQQANRNSENRLKIVNKEHSEQMQKLRRENAKVIKDLRAKLHAFDLQIKRINAKGQRKSQSGTATPDSEYRVTRLNQELSSTRELLKLVKDSEKVLREENERKKQEEEHELQLLNSTLAITEAELSIKKRELEDMSQRVQHLEERNEILLENKQDCEDMISKLKSKSSELQDVKARLFQAENELSAKKDEFIGLSKSMELVEKQNEGLLKSNQDFEDTVFKEQGSLESKDSQLRNLEKELQNKDDKLVEVSQKMQGDILIGLSTTFRDDIDWAQRIPSLTLCSNLLSTNITDSKRTQESPFSPYRRARPDFKIKSPTSNGLTVILPTQTQDSVSELSELEERSELMSSDAEGLMREPYQLLDDIDPSPANLEVKPDESTPRNVERSPFSSKFGSGLRMGYARPNLLDQQSSRSTLYSPDLGARGKNSSSPSRSLKDWPRSKFRNSNSSLSLSQNEYSGQSNEMDIQVEGNISSPEADERCEFDPLNPNKPKEDTEEMRQKICSLEVIKENMERELTQKLEEARESQFKLTARVTTLEEELRGRDSLLIKKSEQLRKYAAKVAKYKSKSRNLSISTLSTESEVFTIDIPRPTESDESNIRKLENEIIRMTAQQATDRDNISTLQLRDKKRSRTIVRLCNKIEQLQQKLVLSEDRIAAHVGRTAERTEGFITESLGTMQNGLDKLFECLKTYSLDLGHLLEELQRRTVDLKCYVADSTTSGYFEQYSLKAMPIKNCITAIARNLSKHPKEMYWFRQYFKDAISAIFRLCGGKAPYKLRAVSSESKSSRVPPNSLHRILQKASLSSVEILPALPPILSSGLHKQQAEAHGNKEFQVEDELSGFSPEKTIIDRDLSETETESSIYPIFKVRDRDTKEIRKSKQRRMSSENSDSLQKIFHTDKLRVQKRLVQTPTTRGVSLKKFVDEAASVFKAESTKIESRFIESKSTRVIQHEFSPYPRRHTLSNSPASGENVLLLMGPGSAADSRRYQGVKSAPRMKHIRSKESKNALLEGLGFTASSYKE